MIKQAYSHVVRQHLQDVRNAYWRAVGAQRLLSEADNLLVRIRQALEQSRDLEKIAELIAEFGWHIEINILQGADWIGLEKRLMDCPVGLVFDHMGRVRGKVGVDSPEFGVVRRLLDQKPETWVKISSWYRMSDAPLPAIGKPDYPDMKIFAQTLLNHHVDRCVWGTNWPHPGIEKNMPDDIDLLDLLEEWIPNEAARQKLFVTNPEKLYDFQAL